MIVDKNKKSNQTCYKDWVDWINESKEIGGKSFADKLEILCQNWMDTHGKTYLEMMLDDVAGKTLVKRIDKLEKRLKEA